MRFTKEQRTKLEEKLREGWRIPQELFGDVGATDIYDFEIHNYRFLLDNASSLGKLLEGLHHLSPLMDDALAVAKTMEEKDFYDFKIALAHERRVAMEGGESKMPLRYGQLVLPQSILETGNLPERVNVTLGVVLIRMTDFEEGYDSNVTEPKMGELIF